MNRLHCVIIAIILIFILAPGCKDNSPIGGDRAAGLYATVVDSLGTPLAGVDVHYIFYTNTNPVTLNAWITYGLPEPQVVTLKVYDPFGRELCTLVNGVQQPAGQHMVMFDSTVTNGVYSYRLQMGDSVRTGSFFIRDDDIVRLQQKPPLTQSDQEGKFFLSPPVLGIGRVFQGDPWTEIISDSITIVLLKPNYGRCVQSFRLATNVPTDKTFTLVAK